MDLEQVMEKSFYKEAASYYNRFLDKLRPINHVITIRKYFKEATKMDFREMIARRAALEISDAQIINLGFGMPMAPDKYSPGMGGASLLNSSRA